ncbi:MAG: hypothetical protein ACK5K7_00210 [Bacilli bacterium]
MKQIFLAVILIVIFCFFVPFVQVYVVRFLKKLDDRKEYMNYKFKIDKNHDEITIEYLVWQDKKLAEIKSRYSKKIVYNNMEYSVLSYTENNHVENGLYFNKCIKFIVEELK